MFEAIQAADWAALRWIQGALRCAALDTLMPLITDLGRGGWIWIAAGLALLATKRYRRFGAALLLGLLAGVCAGNLLLKNLIMRPRPCWLDGSVALLVSLPLDYSFPSGHTLSSTIAATALCRADRRFAWAAVPLAALIALSRLYLFVHFPSDLLGAVALGIPIGLLLCRLVAERPEGLREGRR